MSSDADHDTVDEWAANLGICSVSLRHLAPADVIEVSRKAGLRCIEWGADVHAPPSDLAQVARVRDLTAAGGLRVASYGSYWRAGVSPLSDLAPILTAATTLGAPRIRLWAGQIGTNEADPSTWQAVAGALRQACRMARDHDVELALEFHPNTLTDSVESTLDLLDRVDDESLRTYWQPRLDEETGPSTEGLRRLMPALSGIHVFSWWPGDHRLRLHERTDLWSAVAGVLGEEGRACDLLLEFVVNDDASLVASEAATLRRLLASPTELSSRRP